MIATEYKQQQFTGLLQTLGPDSPVLPLVLRGIIKGSSLSNKEELIEQLAQMSQPDPAAQEAQAQQQQMQMALIQAQITKMEAEAQEAQARAVEAQAKAQKAVMETQMMPEEMRMKMITAASTNLREETTDDFERRLKVATVALKDREITSKENIVERQMQVKQQQPN